MGDDLLVIFEDAHKLGTKIAGFEAGEAESEQSIDLAKLVDQCAQRTWAMRLAAAEGGGLAECTEEDAGEDDLAVAGVDEGFGLGDHILDRLAPKRRPKLGDDTVGAMCITAILDFEEGALVRVLMRFEEGKS